MEHSLDGTTQLLALVALNKVAMRDSSQFQLILPEVTIEGGTAKMEEPCVQTLMDSGSGITEMKMCLPLQTAPFFM